MNNDTSQDKLSFKVFQISGADSGFVLTELTLDQSKAKAKEKPVREWAIVYFRAGPHLTLNQAETLAVAMRDRLNGLQRHEQTVLRSTFNGS